MSLSEIQNPQCHVLTGEATCFLVLWTSPVKFWTNPLGRNSKKSFEWRYVSQSFRSFHSFSVRLKSQDSLGQAITLVNFFISRSSVITFGTFYYLKTQYCFGWEKKCSLFQSIWSSLMRWSHQTGSPKAHCFPLCAWLWMVFIGSYFAFIFLRTQCIDFMSKSSILLPSDTSTFFIASYELFQCLTANLYRQVRTCASYCRGLQNFSLCNVGRPWWLVLNVFK